jgi:hypothetical protein
MNPLIDARPQPDAQADASPDAAAPRSGLVSLGEDGATSNAGAIFASGDVFGSPVGVDGPCSVTMSPAQRGLSAGTISITGTATALTLTPAGTAPEVDYSASPNPPTPLFTAGATISVQASGGPDFPAFSATVTGPAALTGFTAPTALSRAGYTATWTAGTEKIWIIAVATNHTAIPAYVVCRVDDTGTFAIPASTFAMIPADYTEAAVGVGRVSSMDVTTSSGQVTVAAISDITSSFITLGP